MRGSIIAKLHRWIGLGAAIWLAVVGGTGLLLDHKDWRWMRQATVDERWLPVSLGRTARDLLVRFYQIDPGNPATRVAAGWRGAWYTLDAGATWLPSRFEGIETTPLVYSLEPEFESGHIWLATDDGVWYSENAGNSYRRHALPGQRVTGLSRGLHSDSLLAVVDRSTIVTLIKADGTRIRPWMLATPQDAMPRHETLGRLLVNLHLGWGLLPNPWGLLLNDYAAAGFTLLPITGLVIWGSRRRARPTAARPVPLTRWLLRIHVYLLGLALVLPATYFAASGVLLVHREWRSAVDAVRVEAALLPPGYRTDAWRHEISSVISAPGTPSRVLAATRRGLFSTTDNGNSWQAVTLGNQRLGAVFGLRRAGNDVFVIGASSARCSPDGDCRAIAGPHGMVSDIALLQPGELATVSHHGIQRLAAGTAPGAHDHPEVPLPTLPGVPWQFVINQIHSTGLIFGDNKRWANDIGAAAILLMLVTGLIRGVALFRRRQL